MSSSESGQYVIAVVGSTGYVSTDYGKTYTNRFNSGAYSSAMSRSGQYALIGTINPSAFYRSSNYGVTWFVGTLVGATISNTSQSAKVDMDTTGQFCFAGAGGIWRSTDYGVTWSRPTTYANLVGGQIGDIKMSRGNQGVFVLTSVISGSTAAKQVYFSSDYGLNWTIISGPPSYTLINFSFSYLGQYIYMAAFNGVWCSTNYGVSWNNTLPQANISNGSTFAIDTDSTGQYVLVGTTTTGVKYSSDYGASWLNTPITTGNINQVGLSADAKKATLGSIGLLYTSY
jgi:hypothetical protein